MGDGAVTEETAYSTAFEGTEPDVYESPGGDPGEQKTEGAETPQETREQPETAPPVENEAKSSDETSSADDDDSDPHPVPRKVHIKERNRAREAERENAELRGQLKALLAMAQGPSQEGKAEQGPTDEELDDEMWASPRQYIDNAVKNAIGGLKQETWAEKANRTEVEVLKEHGDAYKEAKDAFMGVIGSDPALQQALKAADNPAQFVLDNGTILKKYGRPKSYADLARAVRADKGEAETKPTKKQQALEAASNASSSAATVKGGQAQRTLPEEPDDPWAKDSPFVY